MAVAQTEKAQAENSLTGAGGGRGRALTAVSGMSDSKGDKGSCYHAIVISVFPSLRKPPFLLLGKLIGRVRGGAERPYGSLSFMGRGWWHCAPM